MGFHILIEMIRHHLYARLGPQISVYGKGIAALILIISLSVFRAEAERQSG